MCCSVMIVHLLLGICLWLRLVNIWILFETYDNIWILFSTYVWIWNLFMFWMVFDTCLCLIRVFLLNVLFCAFFHYYFFQLLPWLMSKRGREIQKLKMNFTKGKTNKLNKDERNKIQRGRKIKWTKLILMLMFRGRILMKFWCFCLIDTLTKCCKTRPKNLDQFFYQNSCRLKYVKNSILLNFVH